MRYEDFKTELEAVDKVTEYKLLGFNSYWIQFREDCYQVRTWNARK
jgi:hypothetical protein